MLDTLSYSESLINIGVPEDQAKLQARVLSEALESNNFATTADIVNLESKMAVMDYKLTEKIVNLESKMAVMDSKLTEKIVNLESKLLGKMAVMDSKLSGEITVVKSEINSLRVDLNAQMTAMEMRIIKWQIGGIGLVIAAIKFL